MMNMPKRLGYRMSRTRKTESAPRLSLRNFQTVMNKLAGLEIKLVKLDERIKALESKINPKPQTES